MRRKRLYLLRYGMKAFALSAWRYIQQINCVCILQIDSLYRCISYYVQVRITVKMAVTFEFDPERVAYFEAAGWRAYYDHKWLKMLLLLVRLCQEQFHIPFPMSLIAAYYTTRASLAWVPIDHDGHKVQAYLEKFYRVARRYSGLVYDVSRVAALELQYF